VSDGFSTVDVAADERVEFWREMVRRHFVPLRVEPFADREFNGSAHLRSIAALDFARVHADPMRASRGWSHIERSASDEYFIGLHLRGLAVGDQDGRRAVLRPGDFALFDSARPYRIAFHSSGPFDHLIVRIPREQLDLRCPHLERATALAITAREGPGRLASTSLRTLAALDDGALFVDPVLDLLGSTLSMSAGLLAPPPRREQGSLGDLKRYTINHLGDPMLSPDRVASACFVSVRQLHRLFAREQTTFGAFLRDSRLRRCRGDLADARLASLTIGDIARHHGYRSAATFTRSFSEHYGEGPRAFRSRSMPARGYEASARHALPRGASRRR
jgi:AraC-like DNA-binding protein